MSKHKYIRSHIVEAEPCSLGEWEEKTGKKWNEADRPRTDEGYKCDYPNGYSGWCPKDAFEAVSHKVDTFLDRMIFEEKELNERLVKLHEFMRTEKYSSLHKDDRELMTNQFYTMVSLQEVLLKRISRAKMGSEGKTA